MDKKNRVKIIGWLGTILLITAYTLNSFGLISSLGILYALANFFAALFLGIRVYADRNWSNLVLEFFWISVATINIIRIIFFQ